MQRSKCREQMFVPGWSLDFGADAALLIDWIKKSYFRLMAPVSVAGTVWLPSKIVLKLPSIYQQAIHEITVSNDYGIHTVQYIHCADRSTVLVRVKTVQLAVFGRTKKSMLKNNHRQD